MCLCFHLRHNLQFSEPATRRCWGSIENTSRWLLLILLSFKNNLIFDSNDAHFLCADEYIIGWNMNTLFWNSWNFRKGTFCYHYFLWSIFFLFHCNIVMSKKQSWEQLKSGKKNSLLASNTIWKATLLQQYDVNFARSGIHILKVSMVTATCRLKKVQNV